MSDNISTQTRVMLERHSRTPEYQQAIREEINSSEDVTEQDLARLRINRPEIQKYKSQVLGGNECFEHYASWTDFLLPMFGRRRDCLSVGSGHGRVENYMIKTGFAERFDAVELSEFANDVASSNFDAMCAKAGDLNFADFGDNRFDFILCHGVLRHIIKLEDLLWRIHRALRRDGIVLIYEYIGDDRWQFTQSRLNLIHKLVPGARLRVPPRWKVRGFESIRSSELRGLIRHQFGPSPILERLYGGIYFPFVTCTSGESDGLIPSVIDADRICSAEALVDPCYMMAIYQKSTPVVPSVAVWTDDEVKRRLVRKPPLPVLAYERTKNLPGVRLLRKWVRGN